MKVTVIYMTNFAYGGLHGLRELTWNMILYIVHKKAFKKPLFFQLFITLVAKSFKLVKHSHYGIS